MVDHDPGVSVTLPTGDKVTDPASATRYLMSPVADLNPVASAGREAGENYQIVLSETPEAALPALAAAINANIGQGGKFDYQRKRKGIGYIQYPQFRAVSNFNVGLFMQQTGAFTLEQTLDTAGAFAMAESSNRQPGAPHHLVPKTAYWIEVGYRTGEKGIFGKAAAQ